MAQEKINRLVGSGPASPTRNRKDYL